MTFAILFYQQTGPEFTGHSQGTLKGGGGSNEIMGVRGCPPAGVKGAERTYVHAYVTKNGKVGGFRAMGNPPGYVPVKTSYLSEN